MTIPQFYCHFAYFVYRIGNAEFIGGEFDLPDEEDEDISDYKFSKFAATYFQGNATPSWLKKKIKQPLLGLKHEIDQLVSQC